MIPVWQLQEAKNKLSRVVDAAEAGTPQIITRHGQEVAIILSIAEYRRLTLPRVPLVDFFRNSPLVGVELDLSRDTSPIRDEFWGDPDAQ